jgi:hypothetical protein
VGLENVSSSRWTRVLRRETCGVWGGDDRRGDRTVSVTAKLRVYLIVLAAVVVTMIIGFIYIMNRVISEEM